MREFHFIRCPWDGVYTLQAFSASESQTIIMNHKKVRTLSKQIKIFFRKNDNRFAFVKTQSPSKRCSMRRFEFKWPQWRLTAPSTDSIASSGHCRAVERLTNVWRVHFVKCQTPAKIYSSKVLCFLAYRHTRIFGLCIPFNFALFPPKSIKRTQIENVDFENGGRKILRWIRE